jgi:hypothetical protein
MVAGDRGLFRQTGAMNRRSGLVSAALLSAVATVVLAGCGGNSTNAGAGVRSASGLARFLIGPGDEAGFSESKAPIVTSSLSYWVSAYGPAGVPKEMTSAQLRAEGWKSSATVPLSGPSGTGGSSVDVLGSSAGARADQQQTLAISATASEPVSLTVPGVPSAVGYAGGLARMPMAYVTWVEGNCMLFLENAAGSAQSLRVFLKPVTAAVQSIYRRTSGRCP